MSHFVLLGMTSVGVVGHLIATLLLAMSLSGCGESSGFAGGGQKSTPKKTEEARAKKKPKDESLQEQKKEPEAKADEPPGTEDAGYADADDKSGEDNPVTGEGVDRCAGPEGQERPQISIQGEEFPDNPVDPGGHDNNDYLLTFQGPMLLNGFVVGVRKAQEMTVNYIRMDGICQHDFVIKFRKCGTDTSSVIKEVAYPVGKMPIFSQKISIPENAYIDIHLHTSNCDMFGYEHLKTDADLLKSNGKYFQLY